jgi:hypothetical protein
MVIAIALFAFSAHSAHSLEDKVVAAGTFTGANDHVTTGGVSVVKTDKGYFVILAADFSLDGAPDPKVGFGKDGKYDIKTQLAHLKSKTGEQVYEIPSSVDASQYNEVYIWCEQFGVSLGSAKIQ